MLRLFVLLWLSLALASPAAHALDFSLNPVADAFVTTGASGELSGSNYGGAGALSVSPAGLPQGELQSVLQFNLSIAESAFALAFGGQWTLQSVTLHLAAAPANNSIFNTPAAGQIGISWMQNDSWIEGTGSPGSPSASGITYTSLQSTLIGSGDESLGTFAFSGATSGTIDYLLDLSAGLVADAVAGELVSLRLFAADSAVSGVFNSRSFSTAANRPLLTLTAVPEPGSLALLAIGLALLGARRRSR